MKKVLLLLASFFLFVSCKQVNMQLSSPVFENQQSIPPKYTCDGENISPPLNIMEAPQNTVSLALVVDDPDAPRGTWVHWVLWNIDPSIEGIDENTVPKGSTQGSTDFGETAWGGPCPPGGSHRYFFKLYALDAKLELPTGTTKAELEVAMEGHILETAELIGIYQRL